MQCIVVHKQSIVLGSSALVSELVAGRGGDCYLLARCDAWLRLGSALWGLMTGLCGHLLGWGTILGVGLLPRDGMPEGHKDAWIAAVSSEEWGICGGHGGCG